MGSIAYVGLDIAGVAPWISMSAGILAAFALRALGITRNLHLPVYEATRDDVNAGSPDNKVE